jgi:hypothetical protein
MDDAFAQALIDWTAFYALMGGAAATLLGLLLVAVSVRLNIFHQREVADVRDFAAFTFGTFLVAIAVTGLANAPHAHRSTLGLSLLLVAIAAFVAVAVVARLWIRLNDPVTGPQPGYTPVEWRSWVYLLSMSGPYMGLIAVVLLWRSHPAGLGWLAFVEGWLLVMGTVAAWVMLSHAGGALMGATQSTRRLAGKSICVLRKPGTRARFRGGGLRRQFLSDGSGHLPERCLYEKAGGSIATRLGLGSGGPAPARDPYPSSRSGLSSLKKLLWLPSVVVS